MIVLNSKTINDIFYHLNNQGFNTSDIVENNICMALIELMCRQKEINYNVLQVIERQLYVYRKKEKTKAKAEAKGA